MGRVVELGGHCWMRVFEEFGLWLRARGHCQWLWIEGRIKERYLQSGESASGETGGCRV